MNLSVVTYHLMQMKKGIIYIPDMKHPKNVDAWFTCIPIIATVAPSKHKDN